MTAFDRPAPGRESRDRIDEAPAARAGRMACFCPPGAPAPGAALDAGRWSPGVATLAAGFALSVLSQSLTLGVLPLAGRLLAPEPHLMAAPYVAMLLGAATATFPASFLLDAFGRRAALALGASLGVAGGLIMAWALSANLFAPFCLGAFWLGVAQGFSLFYRHEAALGATPAERTRAAIIVFGSGAFAGLAGPALAYVVAQAAPASLFAATALAAALAQVLVLILAVLTTARAPVLPRQSPRTESPPDWRAFVAPTLLAGLAWFGMTAAMVAAPGAMAGCGIGVPVVFSAISWHVVAMYAPAFFTGLAARRMGAQTVAALGLAMIAAAWAIEAFANDYWRFAAALIVVAIGWSFATAGASLRLYGRARPSRAMLAAHDAVLFLSAIAGAIFAAIWLLP
ncbi:MFS transporter [Rhodoblastus sp. 17X3]|uniref:MFS transporter n=1 Tax=Rhodoblastus sp. 17X3 TaxID=3047026 RepID=UPI0024B7F91F|nr:MFS transporter [Rhodoblastus sp. 17X3]MDI9848439.1 MFS transporter [Rhodoblastus sp. 17X3]